MVGNRFGAGLATLEKDLRARREGSLEAEDLQERIHAFDRGPGKDWWRDAGERQPIAILLRGLRAGIFSLAEVPEEAREHLAMGVKLV